MFHTVVDNGDSMCIFLITCWKTLGSPTINRSPITLKAFDGRGFHPYGILNDLSIKLEGKKVVIEFEVVASYLDYNILIH